MHHARHGRGRKPCILKTTHLPPPDTRKPSTLPLSTCTDKNPQTCTSLLHTKPSPLHLPAHTRPPPSSRASPRSPRCPHYLLRTPMNTYFALRWSLENATRFVTLQPALPLAFLPVPSSFLPPDDPLRLPPHTRPPSSPRASPRSPRCPHYLQCTP